MVLALCALMGISACGTDSMGEGEEGQTVTTQMGTESGTQTTDPPSTATATTTAETTGEDTETETGTTVFVPDNDVAALYGICDPFAQDCPQGEKCVPYAGSGDSFDAQKCVPIMGDGEPGEPCVYGGRVESTDDCGGDSFCYPTEEVDGVEVGVCAPFCEGTSDDPQCDAELSCVISYYGTLTVCVPSCDPLLQDCEGSFACHWTGMDFNCVSGGTGLGEACGGIEGCDAGLECVSAELLPSCDGDGCCTEFCDLSQPECTLPGTTCTAFFEEGEMPGESLVGLCTVP